MKMPVVFYQRREASLETRVAPCVCLAVVFVAAAPGHAAKLDPQDAAFLAARDAFEANHRPSLQRSAPKLKDHLLEPYVEYWQLFSGFLAHPPKKFAPSFRYPGSALAEQLRTDWLKVLGKSGRWIVPGGVSGALRRRSRGDLLHAARALQSRGSVGARRFQAVLERAARASGRLPPLAGRSTRPANSARAKPGGGSACWSAPGSWVRPSAHGVSPAREAIDVKRLSAVIRAPVKFLRNPQVDLAKVTIGKLVIVALTLAADPDPRAAAGSGAAA